MEILISTNMYQACDFAKVLELTDAFSQERVGVEVFSMFPDPVFADVLRASEEKLSTLPISFHGPYAQTEHSRPKGTPAYERSMGFYREMLPFAKRLHSSYVVFHHNNCKVLDVDREAMLQTADENLRELTALSEAEGIPVAVENVGIKSMGNVLMNQEQFIVVCRKLPNPVLIDIGHAHANGWDLRHVMEALQDKIISYHVHNNDGVHDCHQRIYNGTLDFNAFLYDVRELTPEADLVLEYAPDVAADQAGILKDVKTLCQFRETV